MTTFVCYSSQDESLVRRYYTALTNNGVALWMDRVDIRPGADWQDSINHAIRSCDFMLLFLTPQSAKSKEVSDEWMHARNLEKAIVPVLFEGVELPYRLSRYQAVITNQLQFTEVIAKLTQLFPRRTPLARVLTDRPDDSVTERYVELRLELLPTRPPVWVDIDRFDRIGDFLDDLFKTILHKHVAPFSYGLDWVILGGDFHKQVLAPVEWVGTGGQPVHQLARQWYDDCTELTEMWPFRRDEGVFGMGAEIVFGDRAKDAINRAYGICTNSETLMGIFKRHAKATAFLRHKPESLSFARSNDLSGYKHKRVFIDWLSAGFAGRILTTDAVSPELQTELIQLFREP